VLFCKFPLLQYCQIFLRSVNNTQNNRKNSKGARFLKHSFRPYRDGHIYRAGLTENAGHEIAGHENARHEIARHDKYLMKIAYIT